MKILLIALACLGLVNRAPAGEYSSDEDHSHFTESSYTKAAPGLMAPAAYVAIAKKAIKEQTHGEFQDRVFSDAIVTRRIYKSAPPSDRDIIAVHFVYEGDLSGGGLVGRGFVAMRATPATPVVQALIRANGSKVYLNMVKYKHS